MELHYPLHSRGILDRRRFDSPLLTLVIGAALATVASVAFLLTVGLVLLAAISL